MMDIDVKVTVKMNSDIIKEIIINWLPNSRIPSLFETIKGKLRRKSVTIYKEISWETAGLSLYNSFSGRWSGCVALLPFDILDFNFQIERSSMGSL